MISPPNLDAVGDPHPAGVSPSPRPYCVTHDVVLMHFVVAAIEEKLGRQRGPKEETA
jgi:hypothetical protein